MTTHHSSSSDFLVTLVSVLGCAFGFSATLFIIGFLFDAPTFITLAKVAAVIGGVVGFAHTRE